MCLQPKLTVTAADLYATCDRCVFCDGPIQFGDAERTGLAHVDCSEQALRECMADRECPWPANVEAQEFAF